MVELERHVTVVDCCIGFQLIVCLTVYSYPYHSTDCSIGRHSSNVSRPVLGCSIAFVLGIGNHYQPAILLATTMCCAGNIYNRVH